MVTPSDHSPAPELPVSPDAGDAVESSRLAEAETADEAAHLMAERHRDVVTILVKELNNARERGSVARERLSHALVLLDEAQAELIRVSSERDALAKAKLDLEGETTRLQSELHRVSTELERTKGDLTAHRSLTNAALEETGRNRAMLQSTIRGTPSRADPPPAAPADSPRNVSPPPSPPYVAMPSRPPAVVPADPHLSAAVSLSAEGSVAVANDAADGSPAVVVYSAAMSTNGLHFTATTRSRDHRQVAVGITSAPLDGNHARAPLQCVLLGHGAVRIICDGSEVETRLTVAAGAEIGGSSHPQTATKQTTVLWDAASRQVLFTFGGGLRATPLVLPPAFLREALCPVVWLPCAGDDVITRRK